ncbi:MAG: hypothetical protein U5N26_07125 [Candidatus Marinimicrobia bacterium]|nr:hypothetical protein [Candidatus Neomarinimicrobiota bacterium]
MGLEQEDIWLIKTDENGDMLWTKTYGGTNSDIGHSIIQTDNSGFIIVGYTQSYGAGNKDIWLIKTDENG